MWLRRARIFPSAVVVWVAMAFYAAAQEDPFLSGWTLDASTSNLSFVTVYDADKIVGSTFTDVSGEIDESGSAKIAIKLDSLTSDEDLRNVRVRFLLFETFNNAEAVITLEVPEEELEGLEPGQERVMRLPYEIKLMGLTRMLSAEMKVALSDLNTVRVSSVAPIDLSTDIFGLGAGVAKLEETAGVSIVPSAAVSFEFAFKRNVPINETVIARVENVQTLSARQADILSPQQCANLFLGLSESNKIVFQSGNARISRSSVGFLRTLARVVEDCPGIDVQITGHTDSTGSDEMNQALSLERAAKVMSYLVKLGADPRRLEATGLGSSAPVGDNATPEGRAKNRRIEFIVKSRG